MGGGGRWVMVVSGCGWLMVVVWGGGGWCVVVVVSVGSRRWRAGCGRLADGHCHI